ncbi:hypothetical protein F4808DRAFT_428260 [Astrocystis sublimbata]|nr:hypothetical protein F4808DRAFT_428260 [Astrocystis sublimbata]
MPRSQPDNDHDHEFNIYVDSSCANTPMDEDTTSKTPADRRTLRHSIESDSDAGMSPNGADTRASSRSRASSRGASDGGGDISARDDETEGNSLLSERTDHSFNPDDGDQSYVDPPALAAEDATPRRADGDQSSSQHEGTDEDVFTDKSPRSSIGSYDAGSEYGKGANGTTIITRSPRISDISQYDKEDFVPTARGTPRPPFRTPSDVRAMQMSSPAASVMGSPRSPRSSRKHFPSGSRLGTPSASAQYSPKRKSTPPRFKSRQEAPLVLLHVTLLPLRWMWGDLVNNLDPAEMSDQAKTLRNSWRILQDRVGDTVIERGILLGHPQNDYEVLEERLLEALDLPFQRRARILECGHYLGPSNEPPLTENEESEDEFSERRRQSASKRHWCATCKNEIRYDALDEIKVFRIKVYASNGLMRAGAWEACWKEMERVDVELEPVVEPSVQDEIVRLAAAQQEREIAQQEEAEIAKEVAMQFEEQRRSEEHLQQQQEHVRLQSRSPPVPEVIPEAVRERNFESRSSRRRHRDGERLRETYGQSPAPSASHAREPSPHNHPEPNTPAPPPQTAEAETKGHAEKPHQSYQSASLPELLMQSARVLMRDRKNVIIFTLGIFVLVLSLRSTPSEPSYEPTYEPIIHRLKNMPEMQPYSAIDNSKVDSEQRSLGLSDVESALAMSSSDNLQSSLGYQETLSTSGASHHMPRSGGEEQMQDMPSTSASVATIYEPCESSPDSHSNPEHSNAQIVQESMPDNLEETVHETVEEIEITTEKKVVKVVQTVTRTQTQTQTQTETEVEMATAVETILLEAAPTPDPEAALDIEDEMFASPDETGVSDAGSPNDKMAETIPELMPEALLEPTSEATLDWEDDYAEI